jgi:predicted signal transduction protein with EAL and GGDEF domain
MAHLAERVLHAVRGAGARLQAELPGVKLTASVGWAIHPHTAHTVEELMAVADYSLRGAKGAGKDAAISADDFALGSSPA